MLDETNDGGLEFIDINYYIEATESGLFEED